MINIIAVFRRKIDKGIYNFDIMAVDSELKSSILVGYIICNILKNKAQLSLCKSIAVTEEEIWRFEDNVMEMSKGIDELISDSNESE